ncbi:MAG: type II toxin-antitoxin system RelE/ParE family toxin [Lachnospiraceae bacterium]|nr:type II toxin-antitoxin system RelE/ParE family toxin [Lachnospiraceae bacterium]
MKVTWTMPALQDLDEIESFIALDDYDRAVDFVNQLIDLGDSLCDPETCEKGTPVSWAKDSRVRELYYKGYSIVYEVDSGTEIIYIHEVYNQKRVYLRYGSRDHK